MGIRPDLHFLGAEMGFFVKHLHGAYFSIAGNICAVIVDFLRTTYHMPCARVSFLGIPAASCGVPRIH
jgi:hypothetical protein